MKRILCLLLCCMLLPLPALGEESAAQPMPTVRVLLRRLGLTDRADVTVQGAYTVKGNGAEMAFPDGAQLQFQVRGSGVCLYWQGMSLQMGSPVQLIPHSAEGYVQIAPYSARYPGSLTLQVSGGQLQPILTIGVEQYLEGVVPYEMSDDFPLEALKAQAVCARTYALSRIDAEKEWDLEDTANDQVFYGVSGGNANAVQAVAETAGVVGTYNGQLAECFYTASNGGQTELVGNVWSGPGDYSYYAMVDDPYDLANPASPVRNARLSRDAGRWPEEMQTLVGDVARKVLTEQGLLRAEDSLALLNASSMTLDTPRFAEPSRLMTALHVSLQCDLGEAVVEVALTLPVFPDVVKALGLRLNSGLDNELLTLQENTDGWVLESRRYGHGVGMSQRGAQWMALQENKRFYEILTFYYPGMKLMRVANGPVNVPTLHPDLNRTPGPAATATPRPTLMPVTGELPAGAWLASVEGIAEDSTLNLREEPTLASAVLMRLYAHQKLMVLETCEDAAWVRVRTDSVEGYVMSEFLQRVEN